MSNLFRVYKGYFLILSATLFFALESTGIKLYYKYFPNADSLEVSFWGLASLAISSVPYFFFRRRNRDRLMQTVKLFPVLISGISVLNAFAILLWFYVLKTSALGPVGLLIKSTVLYSVLMGVLFLKEKLDRIEISGLLVAIVGMLLVSSLRGEIGLLQVLLLLLAAFLFSLQSIWVKSFAPGVFGMEFAYLRILGIGLLLGTYGSLVAEIHWPGWTRILWLMISSSFGFLFGRALYFNAHNYLTVSRLNIMLLMEPVFLLSAGYLLLGENIGMQKLAGTISILIGLFLVLSVKRKDNQKSNNSQ